MLNAIDEAENRYRLIAENSADVIWTMDMDFNFTYISPAIYELMGYTVKEALAQSLEDVAPDSTETMVALYSEKLLAIQSGDPDGWKPIIFELEQYHKDGSKIWTSNNARILRDSKNLPKSILGITRDITDRVLADQALKESEEKYRNLFEYSMDGVLLVDPEKGYLDCNQAALKLFGLPPQKMISRLPLGELSPQYQPDGQLSSKKILQYMETVYKTGSDLFEWTYKRLSGELFYASVLVALIKIGEKNILQVTIRDISEYKRTQEAMVQSEKMMSVGGLAAGMAHEINNPLAGMIQTADVISKRLSKSDIPANQQAANEIGIDLEDIKAYMEKRDIPKLLMAIHESGRRMASIVQNMLSFARKSDAMVSSCRLCELLDETLELARTDLNLKATYNFRSIEIQKNYKNNIPMVPCEKSKIQQVLLNILRNGAQAMQSTQTPNPMFKIELWVDQNRKMACVAIEDNGPGMDEKTSKRVFEPFFTTKPVGVGTGLGLSVSYFIITENHGGKMSVVSKPEHGSKFIICLPMERPRQT